MNKVHWQFQTSPKVTKCGNFRTGKHSVFGNFKVLPVLANSITRCLMNAPHSISDSLMMLPKLATSVIYSQHIQIWQTCSVFYSTLYYISLWVLVSIFGNSKYWIFVIHLVFSHKLAKMWIFASIMKKPIPLCKRIYRSIKIVDIFARYGKHQHVLLRPKCVGKLYLAEFGYLWNAKIIWHNSLCWNRQKWIYEFLPYLAEIRLADYYQYWRLNIPGGVQGEMAVLDVEWCNFIVFSNDIEVVDQ